MQRPFAIGLELLRRAVDERCRAGNRRQDEKAIVAQQTGEFVAEGQPARRLCFSGPGVDRAAETESLVDAGPKAQARQP